MVYVDSTLQIWCPPGIVTSTRTLVRYFVSSTLRRCQNLSCLVSWIAIEMHLDKLVELVHAVDALLVAMAERVSALLLGLLQDPPDRIQTCMATSVSLF